MSMMINIKVTQLANGTMRMDPSRTPCQGATHREMEFAAQFLEAIQEAVEEALAEAHGTPDPLRQWECGDGHDPI